jgi:hypothetical protein
MRKVDYHGQVVLLALIVITALLYYFSKGFIFLTLIGLLILGIWQIISALTITYSQHSKMYSKYIRNYWMACISMLLIFSGVFIFARYNEASLSLWFIGISTVGGFITAFYYLYLYKKYFLITAGSTSGNKVEDDGSLLTELEIAQ